MAAIQTAIELNDQFTSVLYGIMDAVNLATAQMYDMQQAMSMDIDTSSLEGAREAIDEATASLIALNGVAQQPAPVIDPLAGSSQPAEMPVQWETNNLDVFTGTGIDRFEQEVQSANSMLEQLSSTQNDIASQAYSTTIFPPESFQDLNSMAVRIDSIRERIQQIESNPVNMGTDTANTQLEQLRSQLDRAIQEQNNLNTAMQNMDVSGANAAYLQLSQTVGNTERYIRDNTDEQGRFNQEIQEGVSGAEGLMGTIKRAVGAYVGIQSVGKILNMSDELTQETSRLDLMNNSFNEINGTANETSELVNMVYAAAQDARGSLDSMASVVARFGNNARDAFGNSEEVVAFADLVQKQMAIAGASTQEAANAELQLSQALGSGVLRGDELNSIFEQAPNLIQNIADYLDVPIGQIREMAADGELSADVVKAAIFAAADDINGKFDEMPMTWGQIWQSMQNTAVMAFQPVLQRLNGMANSDAFQELVDGAIEAMATTANMVLNIFDLVGSVAGFVADHWSIIEPIILGVAAAIIIYTAFTKGAEIASRAASLATNAWTAAQGAFNAVMSMNPVGLVIIAVVLLIAIIYAAVAAVNHFAGTSVSATGLICGAFATALAFIGNLFIGAANTIIGTGVTLWNLIANFVNAFALVFNNPVAGIEALFLSLFNFIVEVIESAARMLDAVFGSSLADAVAGFQNKVQAKVDAVISENGGSEILKTVDMSDYQFNRFDYGDAWNSGYNFGEKIDDKISNFSLSDIFGKTDIPNPDDYISGFSDAIANSGAGGNLDSIADDTSAIKDSVDITDEDLKYLRDIAEQEAINRFTTAEVKLDMTNNNNVSSDADLDGIVDGMTTKVLEALEIVREGA
ncbi:phage tail tape measure protein [Roseburia intestinalis]|uniref:Phage tail tape measure protein n=1 Tax=Roseburia intestinalis TaxID=166486 RepID=A0A3R6A5Y5_9FIRM|nr:tape measure protein [Roseburia intestinalis]RHA69782.1 phage tail tape measure protein [Roseburia intestinalis]